MLYREYLDNRRYYQEFGRDFLLERKHACLFYKPGKGKTYPCIEAMLDVNTSKNGKAKVLVLSTADAIKNMWEAEIVPQKILPENTILLSFNSAIVEARKIQLLKIKWDVIVIDESHKIKSNSAKISKLVHMLSKRAEYVWGLSGTPRGNSDLDIFCQFHNMCVSQFGEIPYSRFISECCDVEKQYFGGNCIVKPLGINSRYKAGWDRNVAMYTQRVEYTEDDEMPPLNVNTIKLHYDVTQEYIDAENGIIKIPDYETTLTKLTAISKLHQIVNGFMYITDNCDEDNRQIRDISGYNNVAKNKKLKWICDNLMKNSEQTVIVYRFAADFEAIKSALFTIGVSFTDNVAAFKSNKAKVLLLQCARCESFNLQMCKHIIFYTLDYSYIKYNQMMHRVWRMGQDQEVVIDVLIYEKTVEQKIWKSVQNKEKLADLFMSIKER